MRVLAETTLKGGREFLLNKNNINNNENIYYGLE